MLTFSTSFKRKTFTHHPVRFLKLSRDDQYKETVIFFKTYPRGLSKAPPSLLTKRSRLPVSTARRRATSCNSRRNGREGNQLSLTRPTSSSPGAGIRRPKKSSEQIARRRGGSPATTNGAWSTGPGRKGVNPNGQQEPPRIPAVSANGIKRFLT